MASSLFASSETLIPTLRGQVCKMIQQIATDFAEFKTEEDNLVLFAKKTDLADLNRPSADRAMRIVPVTRDEFKWLNNLRFVNFLRACFGVHRSSEGFLRIGKHVASESVWKAV